MIIKPKPQLFCLESSLIKQFMEAALDSDRGKWHHSQAPTAL